MRFVLLSILFLSLITSCQDKKAPISMEQLAPVLADMHAAEAYAKVFPVDSAKQSNLDSTALKEDYSKILKKHKLTATALDEAITWYSSHPEDFNLVYENVMTILKEKQVIKEKN